MTVSGSDSGNLGAPDGKGYERTSPAHVPPDASFGQDVDDAASDFDLTLPDDDDDGRLDGATSEFELKLGPADDDDVKIGDATWKSKIDQVHSGIDLELGGPELADNAFSLMPDLHLETHEAQTPLKGKVYRLPHIGPTPRNAAVGDAQKSSGSDVSMRTADAAAMLRRIALAVDPGRSEPAIDVFGDVAVVCASPAVHECIAAVLEQLRSALRLRPTLMIRACWLNLAEGDMMRFISDRKAEPRDWVELILRGGPDNDMTLQASCACAEGETARIVASAERADASKSGLPPLGVTLEVTPLHVSGGAERSALLEIRAMVRPGSAATQIDTVCRVPFGRPTLVGGMPFAQAGGSGHFCMVLLVDGAAGTPGPPSA